MSIRFATIVMIPAFITFLGCSVKGPDFAPKTSTPAPVPAPGGGTLISTPSLCKGSSGSMYPGLVTDVNDSSIAGSFSDLEAVVNSPIDTYSVSDMYMTSGHSFWTTSVLPPGVTLDSTTGTLSGTPTTSQQSGGTITVVDDYHDDFNNVSAQRSCNFTYIVETAGAAHTFTPVGAMTALRPNAVAVALSTAANAKVLVIGGVLRSAELFDPATGQFTATTGSMTRYGAKTATLLQNGKVLIAGGYQANGTTPELRLELFDPATQTFALTGSALASPPTQAVALPNGNVLFLEGTDACDVGSGSTVQHRPELYDAGSKAVTAQTNSALGGTVGVVLQNGLVLIRGYQFCTHNVVTNYWYNSFDIGANLYDPATGATSATGSSSLYNSSASPAIREGLLLSDGTVLFADYGGGQNGDDTYFQIYHPGTGTWTQEISPYSDFDLGPPLYEPVNGTVVMIHAAHRRSNSYNVASKTVTAGTHFAVYGHGSGAAVVIVNKAGTLMPLLVGGSTSKNGEYYNP